MRKCIILFLITGIVWAQTGLDKLVLKDGTEFLGEYSGVKENVVYFKPTKALAFQGVPISRIHNLKLKDGKTIITNGYLKKRTVVDYENLSTEEKAVYDAKNDAKKWLAYPILAVLSSGGSAVFSLRFTELVFPKYRRHELILIPTIAGGVLGLMGSHHLFSKLDKNNIEGIITTDIELYKEMYYKEFKKRKLKNIIIGSVATPVLGVLIMGFTVGIGPSSNQDWEIYDPYGG